MTTVYLIRHAEAEGNLYRIAHGQYDGLITDRGYQQLRVLKKRFDGVPIDAVYSSDLFRSCIWSPPSGRFTWAAGRAVPGRS